MILSNGSFTRRSILRMSTIAALAVPVSVSKTAAWASEHIALNLGADGVAMMGYDPVAYFKSEAPVKGDPSITASFNDAIYQFASADNRETFVASPEKYIPAFGGFCAYGVRTGRKFSIDPEAWRIVDDQLYLLLNPGTQAVWEVDRAANIDIANQIWAKIKPYTDDELAKRAP
jgi:hypothetical protein